MGALDGVKVADFGAFIAGPLITHFMASFGGLVVTVESSRRYRGLRTSAPYKDGKAGLDRSGAYAFYSANKYSMACDLRHPQAPVVIRRLVEWADVLVENFTPGTMEKFGLGYEDVKKIKPDIIMLRTSNQGNTGPWRKLPGFGYTLAPFSGFSNLAGWPDRPPSFTLPYTDFISPRLAATVLIAALIHRRETGEGQLIDVSQLETSIQFLTPHILDYTVNQRDGAREGNRLPYAAPCGVYRCQGEDSWCAITVCSDDEWESFRQVLGNPDWAREERFSTLAGRKMHEDELDGLVEQWTSGLSAEDVMGMMQARGVPAGVVQTAEDLYGDPQLKSRCFLWEMKHREMGVISHLGEFFNLSRTPAEARMAAPCLGEHTEMVCRELLGMSEEEYDQLLVDGLFE